MHNPNEDDIEILDNEGVTAYPHRTNMAFIKHFDDKDKVTLNFTEELKNTYRVHWKMINFDDVTEENMKKKKKKKKKLASNS